jgi:hypothetical protein
VDHLVTRAGEAAASTGRSLGDEVVAGVRRTFEAAVVDRDAARALEAGRLVRALEHVGFGALGDAGGADVIQLADARASRPARPSSRTPSTRPAGAGDGRRRRAAEKAVADAAAKMRSSDDEAEALAAELDGQRNDLAEAQARAERLRRELRDATSDVVQARSAIQRTQQALQAARRDAQKARRAHDRAARDMDDTAT